MGKILFTIALCFVCLSSWAQRLVFEQTSDGSIKNNSIFINSMYHDNTDVTTKYKTVLSKSSVGGEYEIKCNQFDGWDVEAADFQNIEILYRGNNIFSLDSDEGWVYFHQLDGGRGDKSKPFYIMQYDKDFYVICFTGVTLASQAPYLSIIVLKDGKATLVYNKRSAINAVNKMADEAICFDVQFELDSAGFDSKGNVIILEGEKHTLTFKNGMIYFD